MPALFPPAAALRTHCTHLPHNNKPGPAPSPCAVHNFLRRNSQTKRHSWKLYYLPWLCLKVKSPRRSCDHMCLTEIEFIQWYYRDAKFILKNCKCIIIYIIYIYISHIYILHINILHIYIIYYIICSPANSSPYNWLHFVFNFVSVFGLIFALRLRISFPISTSFPMLLQTRSSCDQFFSFNYKLRWCIVYDSIAIHDGRSTTRQH